MERSCLIPEHQNQQIIAYCIEEYCRQPARVLCFKCMSNHQGHQMIQLKDENKFLQQPNLIYSMIREKLDFLRRYFLRGIACIEEALEQNYIPDSLNNVGNQQLTNKINCILKIEGIQKLINERLDNIFEHTMKEIKITCQDLSVGKEFKCYKLLQNKNYQEASKLIDEALLENSKNIFLKLSKAEIFQVQNKIQEARRIYEELLAYDQSISWAKFELNKLEGQQERR